MILTEAEHAHFNDLKFMSEVDFKHHFCDIISDTVSCSHDHKNLKKTFLKFIHVINAKNSAFLLIDHCSDSAVETYQNFQKTLLEFTYTTHINNFIVLFCHHNSDSVIKSSSFSMHDNHVNTSVIASASHSCCQYKSTEFINLINNFDDMMKLDESSFIAATDNHLFHDFNAKK